MTTSVTTGRPAAYSTPFGRFDYHHIQVNWLRGYRPVDLGNEQTAFVAVPEKALLDLIYLQPGGDTEAYLRSLRLQALDLVDLDALRRLAGEGEKPKLLRAFRVVERMVEEEKTEYEMVW